MAEAAFHSAGAILTIDLDALAANYRQLADRAAPAECACNIKADAYGIGIERAVVALTRAGARTFFVAQLSEARRAHAAAPGATVYVLNGLLPGTCDAYSDRIRPVLGSLPEVEHWAQHCSDRGGNLPAALHLDTGMNRLGLSPEEARQLARRTALFSTFTPCLLMTHFVGSEDRDSPLNARQIAVFEELRALFAGIPASVDNSSGLFLAHPRPNDLVRPGYALYGGNPTPGLPNPMRPVITLQARIVQLRHVAAGETVGYNGQWTAPNDRRIATLSIGYGDGYPRSAGWTGDAPRGMVIVAGVRCPIVGRISMDLISADVSAVPDPAVVPGDLAEIIGAHISIDDVGAWGGTIGYEVLTRLGQRYARHYIGTGADVVTETAG
mgnify:CR=1 FL=1